MNFKDEDFQLQHLVAIAELTETKVGHELNLINHRVSWLATSQSFLFVAVATLLAADGKSFHPSSFVFLLSIPVMGIVLCIQVLRSVRAALRVLKEHLLKERADLVAQINRLTSLNLAPLGPDRVTDFLGALPANWIPFIFIFSWLLVIGLIAWRQFAP